MKLATTTGDFAGFTSDIDETLAALAECGFRYVDYSFGGDYGNSAGFFSGDSSYLTRVKESAKRHGITFVQAHSPMGRPIARDGSQPAFIEATKKCVYLCRELGIPNIVVHSGYEQGISKEECFERNREFYLEVLKASEETGVNVLTENFNKMCVKGLYWVDNVYDERELIEYVAHPNFRACLDFGHNNMQSTTPHEACVVLGEYLAALHVQDNLGNDDHHMAPFFGTLNLDSVMSGLEAVGYKGYFTFESDSMLRRASKRNKSEGKQLLANPPMSIKLKAESLLHDIGEYTLRAYDCFEE